LGLGELLLLGELLGARVHESEAAHGEHELSVFEQMFSEVWLQHEEVFLELLLSLRL